MRMSEESTIREFQAGVKTWLSMCFGDAGTDKTDRTHRFLEESLELVQACGATREECLQLVGYVYSRPVGRKEQEIGGAFLTLIALSIANRIELAIAGNVELNNCWARLEEIRKKHQTKPRNSPLPQ